MRETANRSGSFLKQRWGRTMKRSRRVILTLMGTAAIGAVSMGFVRRDDCGPYGRPDANGRWPENCRVKYGGFGGAPQQLHGHGHAHGGG
jgi:hypothetical protein